MSPGSHMSSSSDEPNLKRVPDACVEGWSLHTKHLTCSSQSTNEVRKGPALPGPGRYTQGRGRALPHDPRALNPALTRGGAHLTTPV